jgi:uncharacterized protein (TIGR03067 family)
MATSFGGIERRRKSIGPNRPQQLQCSIRPRTMAPPYSPIPQAIRWPEFQMETKSFFQRTGIIARYSEFFKINARLLKPNSLDFKFDGFQTVIFSEDHAVVQSGFWIDHFAFGEHVMRALFAAVILFFGNASVAQELKGDLAKLQGKWTTKVGPNKDLPISWVVEGDKVTARIRTLAGKDVTTKFTLKLDESATPKSFDQTKIRIDFGGDVGELDAEDSPAIYELKGDEWKVCLVPFGTPRPKVFASGESSDLVILRRIPEPKSK